MSHESPLDRQLNEIRAVLLSHGRTEDELRDLSPSLLNIELMAAANEHTTRARAALDDEDWIARGLLTRDEAAQMSNEARIAFRQAQSALAAYRHATSTSGAANDVTSQRARAHEPTPQHRVRASSGSPFESSIGFSRAVRSGTRVVVSGTAPIWPDGSCAPDAEHQAQRCFQIIEAALRDVGARMTDVIRTRMYLVDPKDADAVGRAHREAFGITRPAATMVVVAALLDARWRVEIEAEAEMSAP